MQISPTDSTLIIHFADLKLDLRIFGLYNFTLTNNEINVFPLTTLRLLVAPQHTDTQTDPLPQGGIKQFQFREETKPGFDLKTDFRTQPITLH